MEEKKKRLFAIPDCHGRLDLLEQLMKELFVVAMLDLTIDKLIFLGDYIDRGPNSKGVLDFIMSLKTLHPENVIVLAGNHEWLGIDALRSQGNFDLWLCNGGNTTLASFQGDPNFMAYDYYDETGRMPKMPDSYIEWLSKLPLFHEEDGFFFSHAPVPIEEVRLTYMKGSKTYNKEELTWTYDPDEEWVAKDFGNGTIGVCGHVHALRRNIMEPRFYNHYYYLDSGCGCASYAPLVAVEVATKTVYWSWPEKEKLLECKSEENINGNTPPSNTEVNPI